MLYEVITISERLRHVLPARRIHGDEVRAENRGEKAKRGAQAADRHPGLVDILGIATVHGAGFVASYNFV